MLVFNLRRVLALRGIDKQAAFLLKNKINRQTANNLLKQQTSVVKIEHVEMLCRQLNCTPNDLFEWQGEANSLPQNHSLNDLKRNQNVQNIKELVLTIPLEKVESLIQDQND
jgi:DNA-binding Xre family transcriptional regulator